MIDYFEYIDDYLHDRLTANLKEQFENELSKNIELRTAVDHHEIAKAGLDLLIEQDIRAEIDQFRANDVAVEAFPWKKVLLLIGAVIGLLVVIWFIQNRTQEPELLYASYFKPYIQEGSRGEEMNVSLLKKCDLAHYLMTKAEFDNVVALLEESAEQEGGCNGKTIWLRSLNYLRVGATDSATESLRLISTDSPYFNRAQELLDKI